MVVAILWAFLALRLWLRLGTEPGRSLAPIVGPIPPDLPRVDLIVPARDEADGLARVLESLLSQEYPELRVIAVDDQSTDRTLRLMTEIARSEPRLTVVEGVGRPGGWVGKTWAVHQGVIRSDADWLCFVDADVRLDRRTLATAMIAARDDAAGLVSILPTVECRTFWQATIALPFLQLLAQLYPLERVNRADSPLALAAGGFILVRRDLYQNAGGHESVRHEIVEDIALARRIKERGGRLLVRLGRPLAVTPMYGSFGSIWRGLRKNAYAGMGYRFDKFVLGMAGSLLLAWGPLATIGIGLARGEGWTVGFGVVGVVAQASAHLPVAIYLNVSLAFVLTIPVGITAYLAIATSGVWHHLRGRILWKGRILDAVEVARATTAATARAEKQGPASSG